MAITLKVVNEGGEIRLYVGMHGTLLGSSLAEVRQNLRDALQQYERAHMLRAVAKRLQASGLDPTTATLAQMKTAIESSDVDV